ncbi:MAG: FAD-binding oxidoreductase [Pseudomonadota bacterium]|jgi:glycine/D-amino acid oxidase-like deaminating enzyme|nr:FAD-binding oxidoreductase [Pseudomonadota bacterium]
MKISTDLDDDCVWFRTADEQIALPTLDTSLDCEIAIVGGGYTGLATALRLGEIGINAVVLEAREVGYGGSGRNLGHCTPTLHYWPFEKLSKMYGPDYAKRIILMQTQSATKVFSIIKDYQIKCEAVCNGILRLAASPAHLAHLQKQRDFYAGHGLPGRILNQNEGQTLSGSNRFHGGWLMEGAGHLNPLGYARGLARAARSQGAAIFVHSPVASVTASGTKWLLQTPTGSLSATKVLFATGAYTLGPPWPHLHKAFATVPIVGLATDPLDPAHRERVLKDNHSMVDTHGDPILYKWTQDNRLVTTALFSGEMGRNSEKTRDYMTRKTQWVFPQLGPLDWTSYWYGNLDAQYRTIPRVFRLDDNVYSCLGFSGRGVPTATAMGSVLADLLAGSDEQELSVPVESFRRVLPGLEALQSISFKWARFRDRLRMRLDGVSELPPTF